MKLTIGEKRSKWLSRSWKLYKLFAWGKIQRWNKNTNTHYNCIALIQSSGYGKSRAVGIGSIGYYYSVSGRLEHQSEDL